MDELVIYGLAMGSAGMAGVAAYPLVSRWWSGLTSRWGGYQQSKVQQATKDLGDIFMDVKPKWLNIAYGLGPVGIGLVLFILFNNWPVTIVGAILGLALPDWWLRQTKALRKRKFRNQLVDALFLLSSSLKAGLSLGQAFEVLETEMSPPASQEFGLVIRAHQVGSTLEEALESLNERMSCEELHLITTALLVARETGGDVTTIITQLVGTIREKKKLNDKVLTLTLQGRLQAYIMSGLPLAFAFFVRMFNPRYFDVFLHDRSGMVWLSAAVGLWIVGMFLLMWMGKVDV